MPAITEQNIADLVGAFYGKVRADRLIGPIFDDAIGDNWDFHLVKMRSFWSSVLLASRTYKGNPMLAHLRLPRLNRDHFERWLYLWRQTAQEICPGKPASVFVQKAEMIAERLLYATSAYHDSLLARRAESPRKPHEIY